MECSRCPLLWWDRARRCSPQLLAWVGKSGSRASRNPRLRVPPSSPVRVLQLRGVAAWDYCSGAVESLLGIWHVITLGSLASCSWLGHMKAQTVPVSELKRTNIISISLTTMNARFFSEEYQEDIYKSQTVICKFWGIVEKPSVSGWPLETAETDLQQGSGWHPTRRPSSPAMWLTGSWCSGQVSGLNLWGGRAEFRTLVHQRPSSPT